MKLFILSYLVLAAAEIGGFCLLLMKEYKPNMLKTIIISAMVMFGTMAGAPPAHAATCGYTPDEIVRMTVNLKRDGDPNAAKTVVESIFQNCDDYQTIFDDFTAKYGG